MNLSDGTDPPRPGRTCLETTMSRDYDDDRDDDVDDRGHDAEEGGSDAATDAAMARTNLPGIFLIVVGVINLLGALGTGFTAVKNVTMTREEFEAGQKVTEGLGGPFAAQAKNMTYEDQKRQGATIYGIWCVASLLGAVLPIIAGVRMRSLQSYGLCMAGAIVSVVPCLSVSSCPCFFGAAIGIWAIVVLANADVRNAFR
jgi:hypothetical protein